MKKIITHAGQHHGDDVLAVALIIVAKKYMGDDVISYERKFEVSKKELNDPDICVVDIGGSFDSLRNNYDHHQFKGLAASCSLILHNCSFVKHAFASECNSIKRGLWKFFDRVSDIDLGARANIYEYSHIVKNMGFDDAVSFSVTMLEGMIDNILKEADDVKRWEKLDKPHKYAIQLDQDPILSWKELAKRDGILCLVCPNARGGYQVVSRDTDELVLPEDERATFRHNSGFMIVFETFNDTINYVESKVVKRL